MGHLLLVIIFRFHSQQFVFLNIILCVFIWMQMVLVLLNLDIIIYYKGKIYFSYEQFYFDCVVSVIN